MNRELNNNRVDNTDKMDLSIVSVTEGEVLKKSCFAIQLPASDGQITVLRNHKNIVTNLTDGLLMILDKEFSVVDKFSIEVDGAIAKITADKCVVLLMS